MALIMFAVAVLLTPAVIGFPLMSRSTEIEESLETRRIIFEGLTAALRSPPDGDSLEQTSELRLRDDPFDYDASSDLIRMQADAFWGGPVRSSRLLSITWIAGESDEEAPPDRSSAVVGQALTASLQPKIAGRLLHLETEAASDGPRTAKRIMVLTTRFGKMSVIFMIDTVKGDPVVDINLLVVERVGD